MKLYNTEYCWGSTDVFLFLFSLLLSNTLVKLNNKTENMAAQHNRHWNVSENNLQTD